jgi:hypothetical protein
MDRPSRDESESRFSTYVEGVVGAIGHADRAVPLRDYCLGLLMPGERKSVEPMAAVTAPARVAAQHQSLLHFVGNAPWSDERVLAKVRELVLPSIERSGPIEAWIIDDTGFPKKGRHSVGVTRQYCGQLGKQDNCQVAVTLSVANHAASLPVAWRLYLPEDWAADTDRRDKAGVPRTIGFATKPEIALEQIRAAVAAGIPPGVVLMALATAPIRDCAPRSPPSASPMSRVFSRTRPSGLRAPGRCRRKPGPGAAGRRAGPAATPSTSRSRPRRSPSACPKPPGRRSRGARVRPIGSARAMRGCACAPRIAMTG